MEQMTFKLNQVSSLYQAFFKCSQRIAAEHLQLIKNVREFTLNNPKVLKIAAVKATSKTFRF